MVTKYLQVRINKVLVGEWRFEDGDEIDIVRGNIGGFGEVRECLVSAGPRVR
jgi:hypothetical protein